MNVLVLDRLLEYLPSDKQEKKRMLRVTLAVLVFVMLLALIGFVIRKF